MTRIVGYTRLQALYKAFTGLELDKSKAETIIEVASKKLADLFIAGQRKAYAMGSETVEWIHLPLTLGLEATIERYRRERERLNDPRLDLDPIARYLEERVGGLVIGETVRENLQDLASTILLLIGYIIKEIDPTARKPSKSDIEKAEKILDLTL